MRIALDAMGGDNAPAEIVAGAVKALEQLEESDQILLIGDEGVVKEHLDKINASQNDRLQIVHAPEAVGMDESPVEALRKKRKSSIAIMAKMAAGEEADVAISAGNTGACVAACQMRMRLLPGIIRPGILVVFPAMAGPIAICDVGANIAPKSSHLHQYALMASIYMREVIGIENPRTGLINIGEEESKGNELAKKVNQLLREDDRVEFIGNVEPREFLKRPCEVIVCDGFAGNIILKFSEGLAEGLFGVILQEIKKLAPELVQKFMPIIQKIYADHDHTEFGGAPLLGVDGTCIICHGSSDARAMKNAILRAKNQVQTGFNDMIVDALQQVPITEAED